MKPPALTQQYIEAYREDTARLAPDLDLVQARLQDFANVREYIGRLRANPLWQSTPTAVNPIAPLVSHGLLQASFEDLQKNDHYATDRTLAFIGQTVLSHTGVEIGKPLTTGVWASQKYEACSMAEGYFVDCLHQLMSLGFHNQPRISVYHHGNTPVLLRKNKDSATALTLQSLQLGPLTVPAGTIVAVPDSMNRNKTGEHLTRATRFATYQLPDSVTLAVARLSPWAYRTSDQQLLFAVDAFKESIKINRERRAIIKTADLDLFRAAAVSLGLRCGIEFEGDPLEGILAKKKLLLNVRFKQIALFRFMAELLDD